MTIALPEEGSSDWDGPLNAVLRRLDRRTDRIFTPWEFGAVGNPEIEADDTDAINECVEAAQDNDGLAFINGRFGFAGQVFFKGGVPIIGSSSMRATVPASAEPGLIGLDGAAFVQWGTFAGSGSIDDNPGPIKGLSIDGQDIAGEGAALFRAECAQGSILDLTVRRSAGDGINWASSQNVNVWNLQNQFHAGFAHDFVGRIAGAQAPGHFQFFGGHHGDSYGTIRMRSHDGTFFVGPHDIVFYGPIIEGGRTVDQDFLTHLLLEDGKLTLVNPTITIGSNVAEIEEDAVIVIRNDIRPTASTILVMNDPELGGGAGTEKATDLIRIENGNPATHVGNEVRIHGVPQLANASYGINFHGGPAYVAIDYKPRYITAFTALTRSTSGGDNTGMYKRTNTPLRIEVPADSSVSALQIREDGKAANAIQVAKNGEVRFLDPDTGATRGVVSPVSGGGLLLNGVTGGQGNWLHVAHYTTAGRPAASGLPYRMIYDTDLNIPLWSDGTDWIDAGNGSIAAHLTDAVDAHDASAISVATSGLLTDADVQAALVRLAHNQSIANRIVTGQESFSREQAVGTLSLTSQLLRLTYFRAYKTETVASLRTFTGATAAGATPTTCKMGLYSVDPSTGDLTRIGITANDTALWAAANTSYTKALTAPVGVTQGNWYAVAQLIDTAAAVPVLCAAVANGVLAGTAPRLSGSVAAQTDIPATISVAAPIGNSGGRVYAELVP